MSGHAQAVEAEPDAAAQQSGIRWQRDDEEAGRVYRPALRRGRSTGSLSISSSHSAAPIDPSAALPIQYRTL